MYELIHLYLVIANARLVSERPHKNGCVVFITLEHSLYSVKEHVRPLGTVCKTLPMPDLAHSVRFHIGLVADVHTDPVAHSYKSRIGRIVARTHHIEIMRLHNTKVAPHVILGSCVAEIRVAVVTVYASCLDLFAVYINDLSDYLELTKSHGKRNVLAAADDNESVEVRYLVAPKLRRGKSDNLVFIGLALARYDLFHIGIKELIFISECLLCGKLYGDICLAVILGKRGLQIDILDMLFIS